MCIFSFASSHSHPICSQGRLHVCTECMKPVLFSVPIFQGYLPSTRWVTLLNAGSTHCVCVCVCVCVFYHTHLVLFMPVCKHRPWNDYALYLFTHQVLRCSLVHIRYSVNICRKWWKHLRIFSDGLKMRSWGDSVRNDSSGIKLLLGVRIGLYSGRGKRVFGSSDHILFFEVWLHKWLLYNC